jgi:hypothetical protein
MLSLACFVAIGAVFGFVVKLPGFAICVVVILAMYAAFANGFSDLGRAYDVILAAVALELGYFLAVLSRRV